MINQSPIETDKYFFKNSAAAGKIAADLSLQGFSQSLDVFEKQTLLNLNSQILEMYHNTSMKKAGIGKDAKNLEDVRGDSIFWLQKENLSEEQKTVWIFLDQLKAELNKKLFLGAKEFEAHLTLYPEGSFYKRHIDQFKDEKTAGKKRMVSFVLYLNPEWQASQGGELILYDPNISENIIEKISPTFGKMIFFLSSEFEHEVLITQKPRLSLTGWFYQY